MAEKEKELTKEEKMENARQVALKNLKSETLTNLAAAYLVDKTGQYGEAGNSAVEQFKYFPTLYSDEGRDMFVSGLLGSRQDGKRYSGNVTEYKIISDSAKIIQESLSAVKVSDVLDLMGSKVDLDKKYHNKYISQLEKEDISKVIGAYQKYFTDIKVSEALGESAKAARSGLEELVKVPDKKPKDKEHELGED